tara:strand:+ start:278 stop:631 length:354 start_codon:yes stop_codon:yes gene_type:complete
MIVFQSGNERDFVSYFTFYHLIAGILVGYLGIPLHIWFLLHLVFEILENVLVRIPQTGSLIRKIENIYITNLNKITRYIGFIIKTEIYNGDSLVNCIGDISIAMLGWIIGNKLFSGS